MVASTKRSWILVSRGKPALASRLSIKKNAHSRVNTHPKRLEEENKARRRDAVVFLEEDDTLCVPFLIKSVCL